MNLHHLNIFLNVANTGSLSASAKAMHISQSALSRELKVFEDRLGVTLFERLPRGMKLTPEGGVLESYAERLFDIAKNAELAMREIVDGKAGHLSIGASNTIGTYILPPLIVELKSTHPEVQVSLFIGNTEQVCKGVEDMRFNLGLIEGPVHNSNLVVEPFRVDELLPVVSASNQFSHQNVITKHELECQCLLLRENGSGMRELTLDLFNQRKIKVKDVIEFNNIEAIKQALISGDGIAWLPSVGMKIEFETGVLTYLSGLDMEISRTLSAVRRKNSTRNTLVDHLIRLLSATR
ncbi:CysJI operon transcriptional activator [Pragia fontium]|uniref:LysR family transcriptional regulator n=1 Tax=Pragia fontium TaxID=82985 RepID=UPI000DF97655|nr:LysR family transcriptional regulator [Pragia fontium]SUB82780.1 CysJI operon transcriptional activator [Pragia fontium]